MNILTAEQYADAKKNNQIDPNQLYFTPEKKLVVAVSQDEYEAMKEAGTLDEDVLYVTPASESVTIPEATETTAGLMPPNAVTKLKGIDHQPRHSGFRHDLQFGLGLQQRPDEHGSVLQAERH